jgi:hypothetical protein
MRRAPAILYVLVLPLFSLVACDATTDSSDEKAVPKTTAETAMPDDSGEAARPR